MHLRDYSSFFEPEEFRALTAAYDAAWQLLSAKRPVPFDQIRVLKKNLSQIILASACNGIRDVEQLKEIALRGVSARAAYPKKTWLGLLRFSRKPVGA